MPHAVRRSIRLQHYDYTRSGAYFITICTHRRACLFGTVDANMVTLSDQGSIAQACWQEIPGHFPTVLLDAFVMMPNHLHGILIMQRDAPSSSDLPELSAVIRSFKAATTRRIHESGAAPDMVWQRNFYEQVIRSRTHLERSRRYINENPARWSAGAPIRRR
jgi:REP element-mobilizing transposase RayT